MKMIEQQETGRDFAKREVWEKNLVTQSFRLQVAISNVNGWERQDTIENNKMHFEKYENVAHCQKWG